MNKTLTAAALLCMAACGAPADDYARVALHNDSGAPMTARWWTGPVWWNIDAADDVEARWLPAIEAQFSEIAELTGLVVEHVEPARASATLVIKPWADITAELRSYGYTASRNGDCLALAYPRDGMAVVFIRSTLPTDILQNCIVQETTQMLGLPGDMDDRTDTVFSSYSVLPHLTEADRQLVARHYAGR